MDASKAALLENIFGIDMEYIDPVVWYVYNPETGTIDDFNDEIHYKVHIDRFLELGAKQTSTAEINHTFIEMLHAKSGTITIFEIPEESAIESIGEPDELAAFFDLNANPEKLFTAVKVVYE